MDQFRLPSALETCERVLIAGAGGGFDVFAGLPVYHRLRALGKQVFLANLSFTHLPGTDARVLAPGLYEVDSATSGEEAYFPERVLAKFLARSGEPASVYALEKLGVQPTRESYRLLAALHRLDAIVLIDGGTDILLRGDEAGLGTPEEDMTSLAAAAGLDLATRMVACIGFGIDSYHGVCHANWLQNVAELTRSGSFLGAMALLPAMPEVQTYLNAVNAADMATSRRPSIVNGSIFSAITGHFGNHHRNSRTSGSELFINPLMTFLWCFDLMGVAQKNLYLHLLEGTRTIWEVQAAIRNFRERVEVRAREPIPH